MGKILIIGANGAVGKSCVQKLNDNNDLILVSRTKEEDNESSPNISSITLDINDYENTQKFINSIDYEISCLMILTFLSTYLSTIFSKPFFDFSQWHSLWKYPMIDGVEPHDLVKQMGIGFKQDLNTKVVNYGKNQAIALECMLAAKWK